MHLESNLLKVYLADYRSINMSNNKFTTIYTASGQPEARIIKGRLEFEGIPTILKYESVGLVYGLTIDGLGQVEVQVPVNMVENAKRILDSSENDSSNDVNQL